MRMQCALETSYNLQARKCPVNLTLNEDLVLQARGMTDNLSAVVESLLANFVDHERQQRHAKTKTVEMTIATWNDFNTQLGSFADEGSRIMDAIEESLTRAHSPR